MGFPENPKPTGFPTPAVVGGFPTPAPSNPIRDAAPSHITPVDPWPVVGTTPFPGPYREASPHAGGFPSAAPAHDKPTYVVTDAPLVATVISPGMRPFGDTPALYVGYQNAMNYIVLAGPYTAEEITPELQARVFDTFSRDNTLRIAFPSDKLDRSLITAFVIHPEKKRKGCYGRI